jgi:hypothetical protein
VGRGGDVANAVDHVGKADQPDIRIRVPRRQQGRAADGEGVKASQLDQPRGQRIMRKRGDERGLAGEGVADGWACHDAAIRAKVAGRTR